LIKKKEFKVESYSNNKATISYKEKTTLDGVQNVRMGIDLKTGNVMFVENISNMHSGIILYEYSSTSAIPISISVENGKSINSQKMKIYIHNMKIDHNIKDSIFSIK